MKFGIDIGHNAPPDTGATGIKFEDNLTLDIGNRVMDKLRALGHQVVDCRPKNVNSVRSSLSQRVRNANISPVDIFVSIHFNAFNGKANGTEIYATSSKGKKIASSVLKEILKIGFFNRGVKNGSHLYVVRNTNMPAILIECCFIDSAKDMSLFDSEKMANAIVQGLTGKLPSTPVKVVPDGTKNPDKSVLRLQQSLNRLGITIVDGKRLAEDGDYGPNTKSAIKKFQKITGIQMTGIAGNTTWDGINQILAKTIVRENHASGIVVRYIQYRLGVEIDGIYGALTKTAIRTYQRNIGLYPDGIIGSLTWKKLIG
ncbi:MAG: N-acetylmuramoyl-L-alanine amidase [Cyanobacteria bacterium P01_A01_bin.45]|mgnify:CR=1 FL=1